jgi:dipeptidase E
MLILTSNGISSEGLFERTKEHIKENIKSVALIPTASNIRHDKEFNIQRQTKIFNRFGLLVELFDIDVRDVKSLDHYDVIFLMGGNPFYLLNVMRRTNCRGLFAEYLTNKIVIGASAGSIVFCNTLDYIYELYPELNDTELNDNNIDRLSDFTGLCLTSTCIFPHKSNLISDRIMETLSHYEKRNNTKIIFLEDGQAVFVNEDNLVV